MRSSRAFTLIEVLVTVAILAILLAILVPSVSSARSSAKRAICASNLRQIGIVLRSYIGDNKDRLPYASYLPSAGPFPLDGEKPISISDVLKKRLDNDISVFECPNDYADRVRPEPNNGLSFFASERSSYEYRVQLAGRTMDEVAARFKEFTSRTVAENMIWVLRDYDNFHAKAGANGARRYLYIDGHVTDYEN